VWKGVLVTVVSRTENSRILDEKTSQVKGGERLTFSPQCRKLLVMCWSQKSRGSIKGGEADQGLSRPKEKGEKPGSKINKPIGERLSKKKVKIRGRCPQLAKEKGGGRFGKKVLPNKKVERLFMAKSGTQAEKRGQSQGNGEAELTPGQKIVK